MDAQAKLESGLADLTAAKAEFEQLTGMKAPEFVDHPKELIDVPKSGELLQEIALNDNPKITQAYETLSSSKKDKDIKTGALLPSLDLQASTGKSLSRDRRTALEQTGRTKSYGVNNQVGLTLTIPLYDAGVNRSQRRKASETIIQNRINIEKAKQDIINNCQKVYSSYLAAKANMVSTQKQVKAQNVAVEGITQEMNAGTKTMVEVLYAQSILLEAMLALITATQNYYTFLYQILSLQGKLTATGLELPVEIFNPETDYNEVKGYF
jgi:outer membrane protein TolC